MFVPEVDVVYGPPVPVQYPGFRPGTVAIEKFHPLKYLDNERAANPFRSYNVVEELVGPRPSIIFEEEFKIPEIPGVDSV